MTKPSSKRITVVSSHITTYSLPWYIARQDDYISSGVHSRWRRRLLLLPSVPSYYCLAWRWQPQPASLTRIACCWAPASKVYVTAGRGLQVRSVGSWILPLHPPISDIGTSPLAHGEGCQVCSLLARQRQLCWSQVGTCVVCLYLRLLICLFRKPKFCSLLSPFPHYLGNLPCMRYCCFDTTRLSARKTCASGVQDYIYIYIYICSVARASCSGNYFLCI